ncbi:pheromone-like protein [Laccaria bicolor S238N-H82]|uniref:Pheromone-like protein n=1 Tax=Laccaria bicolor (strain S238N-H82 / ATCC MYA-4686) TaxID=486041 RepID=B0DXD6_LACBS|nr:pheromone-like protein [Laccaria bicolor S238N-H82]EDR00773.1 pheromone-like protein [Laccaria bicolor S238N-H82]|eukprot:XP_001888565.1 pheromone-like protein [Laccaria bicolor S238N-H82]
MDSFTSLESLCESVDFITFQEDFSSSCSSHQPISSDLPIDQERYNAGNTGAFCVIS